MVEKVENLNVYPNQIIGEMIVGKKLEGQYTKQLEEVKVKIINRKADNTNELWTNFNYGRCYFSIVEQGEGIKIDIKGIDNIENELSMHSLLISNVTSVADNEISIKLPKPIFSKVTKEVIFQFK